MSFGSRDDEYNAGHAMGRTFDDGQGAKLLRPENRIAFVDAADPDSVRNLRNALIFAGIMKDGTDSDDVDPASQVAIDEAPQESN